MIFGEKVELKVYVNQDDSVYKLLHAYDFSCVFFTSNENVKY
jgi:hypothetical protein